MANPAQIVADLASHLLRAGHSGSMMRAPAMFLISFLPSYVGM